MLLEKYSPRPHRLGSFRSALCTSFAALLALGACGDRQKPEVTQAPAEETVAPPAPVATAAIADTLGTFEGVVSDLALWQHPSVPSLSGVFAPNGAAGLFLVPVDASAPSNSEGVFSGGVAIQYDGDAPLVAAYDSGQGSIRLFALNETNSTLSEVSSAIAPQGADALCFGGEALYAVDRDGAVGAFAIGEDNGRPALTTTISAEIEAKDCATLNGNAYFLTAGGVIAADRTRVTEAPSNAIALTGWSLDDKAVFLTLGEDGTLKLGGEALTIDGFAGEATNITFTSIAAGNGNFGGVLRDGVLAGITTKNELVLIPWVSIANALQLEGRSQSQRPGYATIPAEGGLTDIPVIDLQSVDALPAPE